MGGKSDLTMLRNKNGEADWFHCMASTSSKLVLLGSDTDIWVYGMALMECGWLGDKLIYVERSLKSEYVNVNAILEASVSHPNLKKVSFPTLTLASIYILTGGDYISSFFKTSKQTFLKVFIENIEHICNSRVFVETIPVTHMGMEGYGVCKIDVEAWCLFCILNEA